ncbi:UNVERIFIED_CONTAM: hypothetical protein FKN15_016288 [Acipenser sinensis]
MSGQHLRDIFASARFVTVLPLCKLRAAPVEGSTRSRRHLGCFTPLQASRCTSCVTALQLSAGYAPHRCKLCAVLGCVTASSPDTNTQSSDCPRYLVLGASAPPCLGLNAHGTLRSSVTQSLDASVLRRLESYMPQRFDALRPFESCALAPLVPCCPRASVSLRFDALGALWTPPLGASMPRVSHIAPLVASGP